MWKWTFYAAPVAYGRQMYIEIKKGKREESFIDPCLRRRFVWARRLILAGGLRYLCGGRGIIWRAHTRRVSGTFDEDRAIYHGHRNGRGGEKKSTATGIFFFFFERQLGSLCAWFIAGDVSAITVASSIIKAPAHACIHHEPEYISARQKGIVIGCSYIYGSREMKEASADWVSFSFFFCYSDRPFGR